jgi:transcriptional antiterminator NusG
MLEGITVSTAPNDRHPDQPNPGEHLESSGVDPSQVPTLGDPSSSGEPLPRSESEPADQSVRDQDEQPVVETPSGSDGEMPAEEQHEDEVEEQEQEEEEEEEGEVEDVEPLELIKEPSDDEELKTEWYILKVQVNREDSIRDALQRRVKVEGLDRFFKEIVVPTEDVAEFTKTGKRKVVKRKLYPGYIMVSMHLNDETWFLVRETPGIGDFTGSAGKPTPMLKRDVERILNIGKSDEGADAHIKTAIPFKQGDRVRVKDGYFQNFEGDVESVDEANGRVTVMINIFGRSTPVELEHWQIETV